MTRNRFIVVAVFSVLLTPLAPAENFLVPTERRASNKGFLSMGLADYLSLLDWTARQIRTDKRSSMPPHLEPIFERLGISAELWVECVINFRKWFRSSVGRPKSMSTAAESRGHNRAISINSSRRVFA